MARTKPKHLKATIGHFRPYLRKHWFGLFVVCLFAILSSLANVYGTYLLKPIINDYIVPGDTQGLIGRLIFMGAMYLAGVLSTTIYTQTMASLAQRILRELRDDLFQKVQTLPLRYFDAHTHGELMSRFTNDMDTVAEALNASFTAIVQSIVVIIGTLAVLLILDVWLSLIMVVFFTAMYLFLRYSNKRSHYYFSRQQEHLADVNGFIEEMVDGQKVVKVFNHESESLREFDARNEELRKAGTSALTYSGMLIPVTISVSYLNYAVSACVGALFAIGGLMDLGGLASYLVYVRQTAMPINQFSTQMNLVLAALAGAEHIFELMDQPPEVDEGNVTLVRIRHEKDGSIREVDYSNEWGWKRPTKKGIDLIPLCGDVRFRDVVFSYVAGHVVLDHVDLYAEPGQKIAFVGATGAGKTTITNLINRFYDVDSGSITYDGIDVRDIKKDDLRRCLSMVLQDTHLFSDSIADNIRYGNLEAEAALVRQAAILANADSFIRRLPRGYQTQLSGDGASLSQGQRQLLSIARAAISDPPVLILDEATSSIDTYTEKLVEEGMDRLMQNRTVFVIAHRLSTVQNADVIMVLDHGKIIERGTHEQLLAQKKQYYQLYTGQTELV